MCPLCNSEKFKVIGLPKLDDKSRQVVKHNYRIVQCLGCEFYYVEPKITLTQDDWKFLYDNSYFGEQTEWYTAQREKHRKERINKLEHYCSHKAVNFLDVGCGEGLMLIEAMTKGWNAFGVDISDNRIGKARDKEINFVNSDLISAGFPDNHFDCVYMDSVLEHVQNPMDYLKEVNRILTKGGIVYIGVPNEDCLQSDFKKFKNILSGNKNLSSRIKPFISPYHIGGFNKQSLKFSIDNAGLEIKLLRNFATRFVFRMAKFPSKEFIFNSALTFVYLLAFILRREYYFEVYAVK